MSAPNPSLRKTIGGKPALPRRFTVEHALILVLVVLVAAHSVHFVLPYETLSTMVAAQALAQLEMASTALIIIKIGRAHV